MDTYCLLQTELDQPIGINDLEEAADATAEITRLDCLGIYRDIHGVIVAGLSHADALAFQRVLAGRGIATIVLADEDLPVLHTSYQVQRIDRDGDTLLLTDAMGQVRELAVDALVFLAAGFFGKVEFKQSWDLRVDVDSSGESKVVPVRKAWEEVELIFRLDLFSSREPHRLNFTLTKESALFHQGVRVRLRDRPGVAAFMTSMAGLLPEERLNSQLRHPDQAHVLRSQHLYENEIRWHFERFIAADRTQRR